MGKRWSRVGSLLGYGQRIVAAKQRGRPLTKGPNRARPITTVLPYDLYVRPSLRKSPLVPTGPMVEENEEEAAAEGSDDDGDEEFDFFVEVPRIPLTRFLMILSLA
jgi:hypothetical protein